MVPLNEKLSDFLLLSVCMSISMNPLPIILSVNLGKGLTKIFCTDWET